MKNIIVGTAGHIDHGKTALVRALTGIDTDRLAEEKRRGISIDLGFAHLEYMGCRFGFVDVPGHERFVRNMLAGAGGIDLVLLVIAADEGVKPQTREHFDICRLLGIRHGLVAVSKADLVEPDLVELARLEIADFTAGSFLEHAPIIPVSSANGQGLDQLRASLATVASTVAPRDWDGPFRLPIDRSFSLRGFGTVVTGTLVSGTLRVEDEIEVYPAGRRLRVRSLQVHGGSASEVTAGQRTAVNLAGVEATDLHRGMVLGPPGLFRPATAVDCRFDLLPSAHPLKHRAPVHFHAGTAHVEAEVRLLEPVEALAPGASAFLRFLLAGPLLLLPGDRFIARMFSPVVTIGGGLVIDNSPPLGLRRSQALQRLQRLETPALAQFAAESPEGALLADLVARTGLLPEKVLSIAPAADLVLVRDPEPRLVARAHSTEAASRLRETLAAFHSANPLLPGMPRSSAPVPAFLLDTILAANPDLASAGETLRLSSHRLALKAEEDEAISKIETLFRGAGLAVPSVDEVLGKSGLDPARSRNLLQILLRQGALIRVSQDLIFHAEAIGSLKALLAVRKGQQFSVPQFKEWTGISRKYAIPLLEFLDRARLTRRAGDLRLIL